MTDEIIPLLLMVDRRTAEYYHEFMEKVRGTLRADMPPKVWEDGVRHYNNYILTQGLKASAGLAGDLEHRAIKEQLSKGLIIVGAVPIGASLCSACPKQNCDKRKEPFRKEASKED